MRKVIRRTPKSTVEKAATACEPTAAPSNPQTHQNPPKAPSPPNPTNVPTVQAGQPKGRPDPAFDALFAWKDAAQDNSAPPERKIPPPQTATSAPPAYTAPHAHPALPADSASAAAPAASASAASPAASASAASRSDSQSTENEVKLGAVGPNLAALPINGPPVVGPIPTSIGAPPAPPTIGGGDCRMDAKSKAAAISEIPAAVRSTPVGAPGDEIKAAFKRCVAFAAGFFTASGTKRGSGEKEVGSGLNFGNGVAGGGGIFGGFGGLGGGIVPTDDELQAEVDRLWREKTAPSPAQTQSSLLASVGFNLNGASFQSPNASRPDCWRPILREHCERQKPWPTIAELLADPRVVWFDIEIQDAMLLNTHWFPVQAFRIFIKNVWGDLYMLTTVRHHSASLLIAAHAEPLSISNPNAKPIADSDFTTLKDLHL